MLLQVARFSRDSGRDLHFAPRQRLDEAEQIVKKVPGKADAIISRILCNGVFGHTAPGPSIDSYLASVILLPRNPIDMFRDEIHVRKETANSGGITFYDLRHSWNGILLEPFHNVHYQIPRWMLDQLSDEMRAPKVEMLGRDDCAVEQDEIMKHLTLALLPTISAPWEGSELYMDHMFSAVVLHLAQQYGGLKPSSETAIWGGLAPWQERRAKELMTANLNGDLSVADLAKACNLSPTHFARAFKRSSGQAPHRWLTDQRVAVAKALLQDGLLPLAEIALASGFVDQSHFTRIFTRIVGESPGAWRRMIRY
jgi:AraC family transcriptional regulator